MPTQDPSEFLRLNNAEVKIGESIETLLTSDADNKLIELHNHLFKNAVFVGYSSASNVQGADGDLIVDRVYVRVLLRGGQIDRPANCAFTAMVKGMIISICESCCVVTIVADAKDYLVFGTL